MADIQHPLTKDTRRRSLLNPFMSAHASIHWKKQATSSIQTSALKSSSTLFLTDVAFCLSDPAASEVDQVVALAALIRALIQPKPQGSTAAEIFHARLIPTISQIATDRNYKSNVHICTQCDQFDCSAAASARRHAAITVLCGVVSSNDVKRLSLDWGLVIVLINCIVHGYLALYQASGLNQKFRKKFSSLSPAVAIHPEATHANINSDEMYRLPLLCLRSLRALAKHYFPPQVGARTRNVTFTLQQSQLIKGGLLSMALE